MDEDLDRVKAAIIVCHGADDPMVKPEAIARSLDRASVDWQLISYSGTVHSFTNLGPTPTASPAWATTSAPIAVRGCT